MLPPYLHCSASPLRQPKTRKRKPAGTNGSRGQEARGSWNHRCCLQPPYPASCLSVPFAEPSVQVSGSEVALRGFYAVPRPDEPFGWGSNQEMGAFRDPVQASSRVKNSLTFAAARVHDDTPSEACALQGELKPDDANLRAREEV